MGLGGRGPDTVSGKRRDPGRSPIATPSALQRISALAAALADAQTVDDRARALAGAAAGAVVSAQAAVLLLEDGGSRLIDGPAGHCAELGRGAERLEAAARDGLVLWPDAASHLVALPLWSGTRPIGALGIWLGDARKVGAPERDFMTAAAAVGAQAMGAAVALEAERARAQVLAKATALLDDDEDEDADLLGRIAALPVPALADFCTVDALRGARLVRAAAAHRDAARAWLLREMGDRAGGDGPARSPAAQAARSGRPVLYPDLPEPALEAMAAGDRESAALRELSPTSALAVPVFVRGRVHGVLALGLQSRARRFGAADVAMAEELARFAALVLQRGAERANAEREKAARRRAEADRERLIFELRDAVQVRDQFLAIASHELKTPLTALQLAVQAAQRTVWYLERSERADQAAARLSTAEKQVRRLNALVDRLLDAARIEAGEMALDPREVDLCEVVRQVVDRFRGEIEAAGCQLDVSLDGPVRGLWDPERLDQLISNLLSNAVKFGAGKPVRVAVSLRQGLARLVIADRGIGIAPGDQQRIFGRFERAASSMNFSGLGLGLWIARRIVDAFRGALRVQSEPGAGATFLVELPVGPTGAAQAA